MRRGRAPVRVAVIGAGLGGIAAAVKLRRRTSATVVVFEQSAGVGGTWFDNRYPGCEVDVHSHASWLLLLLGLVLGRPCTDDALS